MQDERSEMICLDQKEKVKHLFLLCFYITRREYFSNSIIQFRSVYFLILFDTFYQILNFWTENYGFDKTCKRTMPLFLMEGDLKITSTFPLRCGQIYIWQEKSVVKTRKKVESTQRKIEKKQERISAYLQKLGRWYDYRGGYQGNT